jgi:integrase
MPLADARKLVRENPDASDRTRLYVLLMFNCAFTQKDVSDLAPHEVDWQEGQIIRKRSKTRKTQSTPEVKYRLWPETLELLRTHRSPDPTRVLVNIKGKPLRDEWIKPNGKLALRDDIRNAFQRYRKSVGIQTNWPPSIIRKTAANQLEQHPDYKYYVGYFLGHSPQSVKDRYYTTPSTTQFDAALDWLRGQFLG